MEQGVGAETKQPLGIGTGRAHQQPFPCLHFKASLQGVDVNDTAIP